MKENNTQTFTGCIYITINLKTGKRYVGQSHYPDNVIQGRYKGSGSYLLKAFSKYGFDTFKTTILETLRESSRKELDNLLNEREELLITQYHTQVPKGYNLAKGGRGSSGMVTVRDLLGNTSKVRLEDSRYLSGELQSTTSGKTCVKDNKGNKFMVSIRDPRYLRGELVGVRKGMIPHNKGKPWSEETKKKISTIRLKNGSARGENNPNYGKTTSLETRRKISESNKGRKVPENKKNPIITCPYCNKSGRNNTMPRYHFNNCKLK